MAERNNHVTVAIIMHILRADTRRAQQPPERSVWSGHALISRAQQIGKINNFSSHGTVVLDENLWSVHLVVGILDDRDVLRGSRNIVRSPCVSFRRVSSRDAMHNVSSRLRRETARVLLSQCTPAARRPPATFPAPKRRVTENELVFKDELK